MWQIWWSLTKQVDKIVWVNNGSQHVEELQNVGKFSENDWSDKILLRLLTKLFK